VPVVLVFQAVHPVVDAVTEGWRVWPGVVALYGLELLAGIAVATAVVQAARWQLRRRHGIPV
jgi:hypothetical protein